MLLFLDVAADIDGRRTSRKMAATTQKEIRPRQGNSSIFRDLHVRMTADQGGAASITSTHRPPAEKISGLRIAPVPCVTHCDKFWQLLLFSSLTQ